MTNVPEDVLFEIRKENLETGMRGFPVGYCTTSSVDPTKGLFFCGMPVADLASWQPESVLYLLYHGTAGSPAEVNAFSDSLQARASLPDEVVKQIRLLPRTGHPMKLFCASLLILGMFAGKSDYRDACLDLFAKIPLLTAEVINHHAGWGGTLPSRPQLGYIENFTQMLNVPDVAISELTTTMKLFNILHYDHGGGNLSTFVGKAVASGLEDMYGSIASAMSALAGPRHGRANQDSLQFVSSILDEVGSDATAQQVEAAVRRRLEGGELIYGFGHAVLRVEDPRATVLYNVARDRYSDNPLIKICFLLRSEGTKVLKENPKVSNPYPNVDAISGSVLSAAGFSYPEYFTVLFGLSRTVGIARQIVYERSEARDGKGTPIVRPKYLYTGR